MEFEEQKPLDFVYQCEQGFVFEVFGGFSLQRLGKMRGKMMSDRKLFFPEQKDEKINKYQGEFLDFLDKELLPEFFSPIIISKSFLPRQSISIYMPQLQI